MYIIIFILKRIAIKYGHMRVYLTQSLCKKDTFILNVIKKKLPRTLLG